MSQGIEVWNASGQKILSVTDTITRVLGTVTIDGSQQSGSISVSEITAARGWSFSLRTYTASPSATLYLLPVITINNGSIDYAYQSVSDIRTIVRQSIYLTYGLR